MKKKTYVLTVSEFFPKTHKRYGEKTDFIESIKYGFKLHTIRGNYELWKKRVEKINSCEAVLSVRVWTGKPYASKQKEVFQFDCTHGISIEQIVNWDKENNYVELSCIHGDLIRVDINLLCVNDGLHINDFNEWFKNNDSSKPMAIIHFTKFRYDN